MAGGEAPEPPARPLASSVLGVAIIAITGMQLMSTLDGTIVIVALPRMQADLDLSDAAKSWVITAYVLTFGGLLLLGGRVGDAIGHKRAFISGVGVFTIASMACGMATDGALLIAARAVQGIGAAVAAPTGLALIATTYAPGHARNQAMAMSAAMQGLGSVLGLVIGGALTVINWRLAFLINLPIGALIVWIAVTRLEETRHERLKLDVTGALLATLGCTAAVLVFTQGPPRGWTDPFVIGAGVAAVALGIGFFIAERNADQPAGAAVTVRRPQPGDDVHLAVHGRRGDADADRHHRALRAGCAGLLRTARRHRVHPVRSRTRPGQCAHRPTRPACRPALAHHRRRSAGAGRDALRVHPDPHHPVFSRTCCCRSSSAASASG